MADSEERSWIRELITVIWKLRLTVWVFASALLSLHRSAHSAHLDRI